MANLDVDSLPDFALSFGIRAFPDIMDGILRQVTTAVSGQMQSRRYNLVKQGSTSATGFLCINPAVQALVKNYKENGAKGFLSGLKSSSANVFGEIIAGTSQFVIFHSLRPFISVNILEPCGVLFTILCLSPLTMATRIFLATKPKDIQKICKLDASKSIFSILRALKSTVGWRGLWKASFSFVPFTVLSRVFQFFRPELFKPVLSDNETSYLQKKQFSESQSRYLSIMIAIKAAIFNWVLYHVELLALVPLSNVAVAMTTALLQGDPIGPLEAVSILISQGASGLWTAYSAFSTHATTMILFRLILQTGIAFTPSVKNSTIATAVLDYLPFGMVSINLEELVHTSQNLQHP